MSLLGQFSKDTIVYGLGKGIKKFIGLLLLPVYTRALSPAEFGILDTLGAVLFFITVFLNFGLDSASGYYFFQTQDEKEKGGILFTVFVLRLLVVIPALILSFFCVPISNILFQTDAYSTSILITCISIPVTMLMSEQELVYRFHRNAWGYNIITIIKSLLSIGAGVLLVVHFKLGVFGAQMAAMLSTLVVVIVSLLTFTRKKYYYQFSFKWAKKMTRFGFPLIWAGMAVWVYSVSDRFFILHYRDVGEIGFYSIGSTFSQPISLINMAIQMSFGVLFYDVFNKETGSDKPQSKELMTRVLYIYIAVASALTLGLSIFAYDLVSFVTTSAYLAGIVVIPVLTVSNIFSQIVEIVPVGISISEKTWHYTWIIIVAALVNAGLNFIFVPLYGFLGAAFTTLAAYFTYYLLSDIISKRYFNSGFSRSKILSYLLVILGVSFTFPFLETYYKMHIPLIIKLTVYILSFSLPFIFKLVTFSQVNSVLVLIKSYKKR